MLEAVWAGDAGKKEQVQPHCPHLNIQTPRVWLETPQSSHKASPRSLLSLSGMQLSCLALSDIGVCKLFLNSCSCLSVLGAGVSFNREHFLPRNLWATLQMNSAPPPQLSRPPGGAGCTSQNLFTVTVRPLRTWQQRPSFVPPHSCC